MRGIGPTEVLVLVFALGLAVGIFCGAVWLAKAHSPSEHGLSTTCCDHA